jgi:Replication initiator protein A
MKHEPTDQPGTLEQVETLSELLRIGKDEMNLAEFPMTSLSDKPISGESSLKFEDQIYDERRKKIITRKRIIEGSKEYGLPTATDDSVILALIQLTKLKNGFSDRDVEFSRHELINLLQWPNKGQSYERIAQALHRVAGVTYHFENSWWDNHRKTWTTKIFGIIDTVELNDSRETDSQGGLFPSRITWNQIILDSFQAGYLRSLDFQLAISFKHAISLRIYRFMGKRFHLKPDWAFDIKDFSYEHIGLSRNYEGGTQIARKLKPAIVELEEAGFLEPLPDDERFIKKGRDWTIRLIQKATALPALPDAAPIRTPDMIRLAAELTKRGVHETTAAELAEHHPAEKIDTKIEEFDWLVEKKDRRIARSPSGFLVKSITTGVKGYGKPTGFVSQAERDQQAEAKRQAEKQADDARRRKHAEEAAERDLNAKVAARRKAATATELAQLEADAIAQASEETRQSLDNPDMQPFRKTLLSRMTNEHIARLILAEQEPAV